jgi:hypothetical protein
LAYLPSIEVNRGAHPPRAAYFFWQGNIVDDQPGRITTYLIYQLQLEALPHEGLHFKGRF